MLEYLPPLNHPHVRPDWARPIPPLGFHELCCHVTGGGIELDFVNNARRDFASRVMPVTVDWPWEQGYSPSPADWQAIGIDLVDFG